MLRHFSILLLTLVTSLAFGQDKIEAERPSESQAPQTLSKKEFQVEVGFQKVQLNKEDRIIQHPEALLRLGLTNKLELRSRIVSETQKLVTQKETRHGLDPIELGIKLNYYESPNKKFATSLLGHVGIPILTSDDYDPGKVYHRIRLLFENQFTDKLSLEYNAGTDWDSEEQQQNWVFTISPHLEVTDHLMVYIEEFSFLRKNSLPQHHLQGGLAYSIGTNIQVDASGGLGLNTASPDYFINAGLSFRFH